MVSDHDAVEIEISTTGFPAKKTDHDQLACFNRTRIGVEIAAETG
jgi:hypothetical protein